jgi:5-methylcytosine-specific restriction endonuclease McrA
MKQYCTVEQITSLSPEAQQRLRDEGYVVCQNCGAWFWVYPYRRHKAKYCSRHCMLTHPRTAGERANMSAGQLGRDKSTFNVSGLELGREINRTLPRTWAMGEKNNRWRGGVSKEAGKAYHTAEYKAWRKAVFERDNYTCQICGTRGVKLHAHHLMPRSVLPDKTLDPNNGIAVCVPCHKVLHPKVPPALIENQRPGRKKFAAVKAVLEVSPDAH